MKSLLLCGLLWAAAASAPPSLPPLVVQAPRPQLKAEVVRLYRQAAPRLSGWLQAAPPRVTVVVAPSRGRFNRLMARLGGPRWAAGAAIPGRNLIVMRSPGQLASPGDFGQVLVHEMSHLWLAAALGSAKAPAWLDEGLAMYAAGGGWRHSVLLAGALWSGGLIPLAELEHAFPRQEGRAGLAYAQSHHLIAFLLRRWGPSVLARLVRRLRRGQELSEALRAETGLGLLKLEDEFHRSLRSQLTWMLALTAGGTLWGLAALVAAVGLLAARRRQRRRLAEMAAQEEAWEPEHDPSPPARRGPLRRRSARRPLRRPRS